jgi:hypothetical protein
MALWWIGSPEGSRTAGYLNAISFRELADA